MVKTAGLDLIRSKYGTEFGALPDRNVLFMLFTIGTLKKVDGRLKLFKLQHLLQTEAQIEFDRPDEENDMGYTDYATLNTCLSEELINQTETQTAFGKKRYDYELTPIGKQIFSIIRKKFPLKKLKRASAVLIKYRRYGGFDLMAYTHKKYIDDFESHKLNLYCKGHFATIQEIQKIMDKLNSVVLDTDTYIMSGKLDHVKNILKSIQTNKSRNRIVAGTLISAIQELEKSLTSSTYKSNDWSEDLFAFIEHYAEKEGVMKSMASFDLSELPEEDKRCLAKFLNQVKPLLSS